MITLGHHSVEHNNEARRSNHENYNKTFVGSGDPAYETRNDSCTAMALNKLRMDILLLHTDEFFVSTISSAFGRI